MKEGKKLNLCKLGQARLNAVTFASDGALNWAGLDVELLMSD